MPHPRTRQGCGGTGAIFSAAGSQRQSSPVSLPTTAVTMSSGHPVPTIAALESSWSVVTVSKWVFLTVTESSGHPVPQLAALESSWSVVTESLLLQLLDSLTVTVSSGHLVPQLAAPESSWSVVTQSECHRVKVIWFRSLQPQSLPCQCHSVKESESHKVIQFRLQPWSLPCLCHEILLCIVMCLSIYTFLPLFVLVYRGLSFHIDWF
jgi:hypothetical protein